jgi:hypothetical protein
MSYCNSDYCPGCGEYVGCKCDEDEMTEQELIDQRLEEQLNRYENERDD